MRSWEACNVFTRLAELSVHGANMQKGQIVLVQAEFGLEEQARQPGGVYAELRHQI